MLNQNTGQDASNVSNQDKKNRKSKKQDKARKDQIMARINGNSDHEKEQKKHENDGALGKISKKTKKS